MSASLAREPASLGSAITRFVVYQLYVGNDLDCGNNFFSEFFIGRFAGNKNGAVINGYRKVALIHYIIIGIQFIVGFGFNTFII